jgi:hypothetical protein
MRAPLHITVQAGNQGPGPGEVDMIVTIDVNDPQNYPLTLMATAPSSGQLLAGNPQEQMLLNQRGRVSRTYKIRTTTPLHYNDPFQVVLRGQNQNNSAGLIAKGAFPPPPEVTVPSGNGPRPTGGRPPGPSR